MNDNNPLTQQFLEKLKDSSLSFREFIDMYLEHAWHDGYDAGQEDAMNESEQSEKVNP